MSLKAENIVYSGTFTDKVLRTQLQLQCMIEGLKLYSVQQESWNRCNNRSKNKR